MTSYLSDNEQLDSSNYSAYKLPYARRKCKHIFNHFRSSHGKASPNFCRGGRPAYGKDSFLVLRISRESTQTARI